MRWVRFALGVVGCTCAVSCGLAVSGAAGGTDGGGMPADASGDAVSQGEAGANADAGPPADGAIADGGTDAPSLLTPACSAGTVLCNGACVSGNDCAQCGAGKLYCAPLRTCMSTCSACTELTSIARPIECFACNPSQQSPIGTCEPATGSAFCLSGDYSAAYKGGPGEHCDCSNTQVSNCVGAAQVCRAKGGTDWCITCGESGQSTNGLACKGGGTCNANVSPPRCE